MLWYLHLCMVEVELEPCPLYCLGSGLLHNETTGSIGLFWRVMPCRRHPSWTSGVSLYRKCCSCKHRLYQLGSIARAPREVCWDVAAGEGGDLTLHAHFAYSHSKHIVRQSSPIVHCILKPVSYAGVDACFVKEYIVAVHAHHALSGLLLGSGQ
jgi:hypothetical protein